VPGEVMAFYSESDDPVAWRTALERAVPDLTLRIYPDFGNPEDVRYALVWDPPNGFFSPFTKLELVINLGAGVDALLDRADLPWLPIVRLFDPNMARMMSSYVQMAVLRHARDIVQFERAKRQGQWTYIHPRDPAQIRVGVMGLGELGGLAAAALVQHRFQVFGWSRRRHQIEGVTCSAGIENLDEFLGGLDILVCMLPLTPITRGLLNAARFAALPRGAAFVNVARGDVVDEPALIEALRRGHLGQATLDVFATEPLPAGHPFWAMDNVLITPHVASTPHADTDPPRRDNAAASQRPVRSFRRSVG
jgi:glyoxylate/hydroxypyruvate reductase A